MRPLFYTSFCKNHLCAVGEFDRLAARAVGFQQHHVRVRTDPFIGFRRERSDFFTFWDACHDVACAVQLRQNHLRVVGQHRVRLDEHMGGGGDEHPLSLRPVTRCLLMDQGGLSPGPHKGPDHSAALRCRTASSTPPAMHRALSEMVKQLLYSSSLGSMSAILKPSDTG